VAVRAKSDGFEKDLQASTAGPLSDFEDDAGVSGALAGENLSKGVKSGAKDLEKDLGGVGNAAGSALGLGVKDGSKDVERDLESTAKTSGGKFSSILGGALSNLGGPFTKVTEGAESMGSKMEKAGGQSSGLVSTLVTNPYVMVAAAVVGVATVAVDMAAKYQTVTNKIAANMGITTKAGAAIGDAFLTTAGKVTFSGSQIASAFAGVAGQADALNGGALTAQQSLGLMDSAMDLAEASGTDLATATAATTNTLQAFGLKISDSPLVADVLYNAANKTGQTVGTLSSALDKMKAKMGDTAPSLTDMGGLLVDLTEHGETGRAAMTAIGTAFQGVVIPAGNLTAAQAKVKAAQDALGVSFQTSNGSLDSVSQILTTLGPILSGESDAQAVATLTSLGFGTSADKLLSTFRAGPAVFDADTAAVSRAGSAHKAAATATSGLGDSFEKIKSAAGDAMTAIGEKLLPVVATMMQDFAKAVNWVIVNWPMIAKVIGDVVSPITACVKLIVQEITAFIDIGKDVITFFVDVFEGKWGAAWDQIGKVFGAFKNLIFGYINDVLGMFGGFPRKVIDALGGLGTSLVHVVESAFDTIRNAIRNAIGDVVTFVKQHWELLAEILLAPVSPVLSLFLRFHTQIIGFFSGIVDWAKGHFGEIADKIRNVVKDVVGFFTDMWDHVKAIFSDISEGASNLAGHIVGFFRGLPAQVLAFFNTIWTDITGVWAKISASASSLITDIVGFFKGLPTQIMNGLDALGADFLNLGKKLIDQLIAGIKDAPGALVHAIESLIPGGGIISKAASILHLASGGLVTTPTFAQIGEAGPELVLSADQTKLALSGGAIAANPLKTVTALGSTGSSAVSGTSASASSPVPTVATLTDALLKQGIDSDKAMAAQMVTLLAQIVTLLRSSNASESTSLTALTTELRSGQAPLRTA
jgi:TP901 family phage tail tape measure protein